MPATFIRVLTDADKGVQLGAAVSQPSAGGRRYETELRALWALHSIGHTPELEELATDRDEHIRAWGVQLALEDRGRIADSVPHLVEMANSDSSAVVRLYLASALQRLSATDRVRVATGLVKRS